MSDFDVPAPEANPTILGQERAERLLLRARRAGRMPHGWLFYGRVGIGKATLAFRLARHLLQGRPDDPFAMDQADPIFRQVANRGHPDLVVLQPKDPRVERGRAEIGIEEVRQAIDRLHRTAGSAAARVLVVDRADLMNPNAANALLKLLEEPRPGVFLLLTAAAQGGMPSTLRSRVARLRLQPVLDDALAGYVGRVTGLPMEMCQTLARVSGGSPGTALRLAETDAVNRLQGLEDRLHRGGASTADVLTLADDLHALSQTGMDVAMDVLSLMLRDAVRQEVAGDATIAAGASQRLDRLWALWDKLAVLDREAERLSLDRRVLLFQFADMLLGREPAAPIAGIR